jgi:large subunit ribosomal protein L25
MEEIQFSVQLRTRTGKEESRACRKEALVPGVVYGGEDAPVLIKVDRRSFDRIERTHKGQSFILHLNILEGEAKFKDYPVLVKDIQYDPVTDEIRHIDFIRISLTEKVEVKVPLHLKGDAIGVKEGGSLEHHLWEIDVVCLPTQIPTQINIDVSTLKMHDVIHVKDIVFPADVHTDHDPEAAVVSVVPATREVEEEGTEEPSAEPEVIKEKKKEETSDKGSSEASS